MSDWRPIATAPRDGTVIEVMDEDCGRFHMRWNVVGQNLLVSTDLGIWEDPEREFTWSEHDGFGPTWWRPASLANPPERDSGEG